MSEQTRQYYYRTESKAIQRFVLRGRRLRDQLGGSALVKRAFDDEVGGLLYQVAHEVAGAAPGKAAPVEIIAAAAGGATLRFDSKAHLARFAALWPRRLEQEAPGLRMVHAWCDAEPNFLSVLHRKLQDARERMPIMLPLGNPVIDRPNQGSAPATRWDRDKGELVDATLEAQRREAKNNTHGDSERDTLHNEMIDDAQDAVFPINIDEIVGRGDRHYVAVIQVDGNDVGRRVRQLSNLDDYKAFAKALKNATKAAAKDALATLPAPRLLENTKVYRGRPIVLGGDDVTFVVRADAALDFVRAYATAFEHHTGNARALKGALTASAGIAFVRSKHPFRQAHRLAESLIDQAKARGRLLQNNDAPPAMVAFERVTTSLDSQRPPQLTFGPYQVAGARRPNVPHLEALRDVAKLLSSRELPRGPFRALAETLREAPNRATAAIKRIEQVQGPDWAPLAQAITTLTGGDVLWKSSGIPAQQSTPWLDILALVALGTEVTDAS